MSEPNSSAPYGPMTASVRAFLVRFAGLSAADRRDALAAFQRNATSPTWLGADRVLGDTIERAGRTDWRDALAGPLLQLVRRTASDASPATLSDDDIDALDPIAEPALAALMALLVRDLLPATVFDTLYAPFATLIPVSG